ncbi:MAG TPA: trypsin-like peptidase domain-containing protein [Pirellulales bacterium]|jgi:S1-C subfamily serine protease
MKTASSLCLLLLALPGVVRAAADEAVLKAEADRVLIVARASEAALAIFAAGGQGGGSGVVISHDGYALSNFHVTKGSGDAMKCGMADGRMYDAVIVGIDPVGDVALLKLLGRDDFPHAELGDSDQVQVGDWAFAIGNPFLLATDFTPSVSYGIISGVHRYQYPAGTLLEYTDCLQTDASINPGNSGGPLFDSQGRLIGINGRGSFEKRGRVNVGVGYAISINQIKNFLGHLKAGRVVDHATLGARVTTRQDARIAVSDILDDSDAFRRGLRQGDEVVRFGGRAVSTVNAFKNVLGIFPKDWRVALTYRHEGKTFDVAVRLAGLHNPEELLSKVQGRVPSEPGPRRPDQEKPERRERQPMPDGDQPDDQPDQSAPHVAHSAPMPPEVKAVFEARRGYANYFFNKVERARTWNRCVSRGDFHEMNGAWVLKGELPGGGDAELRLTDNAAVCIMPGTVATGLQVAIGEDLTMLAEPPGSGGMLAALSLWRRLLILGPERFGEISYLGTVPALGTQDLVDRRAIMLLGQDHDQASSPSQGLCDALEGTYGGVDCRFVFDPKTGNLSALEMYRVAGDDPCELHFSDYAEIEGRVFPRQIECRYGDAVFAAFKLSEVRLDHGEAK